MNDEVKTLAEWLLDPTTTKGDEFLPEHGMNEKILIGPKDGMLLHYVAGRDGWDSSRNGEPGLEHYRARWRRHVDLTKLTAQQALDRGILVRP